MRRTLITTTLLTAAGIALTGASTCGPQGPGARDFAAGSLVIPMDNCYQHRDTSASNQTVGCTTTRDDGVFRAYGLVYFLLKHNVPVYWAIDNGKTSVTAADVTATASSGVVAQKMSWAGGTFADVAGLGSTVNYIGGPFVIDATDVASFNVVSLLQNDPDFARFKSEAVVDIHKVQVGFHANQVRPLSGPPPKLAILNITAPVSGKTSSNVMYQYAVAAGLSWPCTGNGDCAGGLGPSCDKAAVLAYLASPGGDTAIPQVCNGSLCAPNFNTGANSGLIYDILCGGDFIPPAGGTYADTQLAKGNYKMLWIPHWDTHGPTPTGSTDPNVVPPLPPVTTGDTLAWQLRSISSFVNAGNNLFVECLGIQALEGIVGQDNANSNPLGIPATRFQSPAGMLKWNGANSTSSLLAPAQPNLQVGDFAYNIVSGAITTYYPDASKPVASAYLPGVQRLITTLSPTTTSPPAWDVGSTIQVTGTDGALRGTVAYLGGHDYSPSVSTALSGQTAGTRIVLNTLFNLGFGCSDPNTTCTTGLLGACAQGVLKCAPGGGLQCVGAKAGAVDCTTPGADANCNGVPDANEQACQPVACAEGAQRECYDGPAATDPGPLPAKKGQCVHGKQTCTGGLWGACEGEVTPQPEVCNGLDDDCNGQVDDGNLCSTGFTCQPGAGVCLPITCNNENARCPAGFECLTSGGSCTPVPCGVSNTACPAGKVCQSGQCVDPCQGLAFTCGAGAGCSNGQCVAGGCTSTPTQCSGQGQVCVSGICTTDPCAGLTCPTGTFCRVGPAVGGVHVADCVRSCSYVGCAAGETCSADGFCEPACSPACAAGQACVSGACVTDPKCATVQCGAGQVCSGGACIDDACKNVHCNPGTCSAGQCVNGGVTTSQTTPIKQASSGGCGTGGGGDLAALAFLGAVLATRRRRLAPALAAAARRSAPLALALLLAAGAACSKKGGTASCTAPQTACGAECADLQTSALHCGVCGHGCAAGFQCVTGGCVLPTGNPHLLSVTPATIGRGAAPALKFTFDGLDPASPPQALSVRVSGAVQTQELPLTLGAAGTATLPAQAMDLTAEAAGTASQPATIEVRLLNMPGRLVSNPLTVTVVDALVARTLTPALVSQSQTAPQTLDLQGLGFLSGATVAMAPTGSVTPVPLSNLTVKGPGELTVDAPAPSTLKLGRYDVTVSNPGGATSNPLAFTVTEGTPVLGTVNGTVGTCVQSGGRFDGTASGQFFYPSSVVHVTGNSITDSPLDTSCLNGTDALGQCVGGQIHVSADLTLIQPGSYDATVVNPGPKPLVSNKITITVKTSCP
ncbi:putative metal-binding motif-containing protein [Anaeromyxobacter diazotrophicus]|uniref:Tryptophan synthase alpha chain n=1 Tax=Anaeromyxobacter diazotrophicus TaxID=2590199 RepID=A0A7I9VN94_9BACT|nr:putative metal-binding motif-containing protein [Anaeromyxobacter diazotrophicus]GEJ57874.1 hypothetical protein AMYX_26150 [Anaeromyxobacter diazotrophicus]